MRELGLAFFWSEQELTQGFAEVLSQKGMILFVYGALMTVVPLAVGFAAARKICRLNILESMVAICGRMTSTPALIVVLVELIGQTCDRTQVFISGEVAQLLPGGVQVLRRSGRCKREEPVVQYGQIQIRGGM